MTVPVTAGAVYDRGYRPYEGVRGGRRAATVALYRASIRRALGLRRSWRQKAFPWMLLAIATVPAIINVGIGYVTKDTPAEDFEIITYREYVGVSTMLLLFVALTAPDIICPDRRQRVLPIIFARPLTGTDYVIAKVGAIATILFAFGFFPQVVLFVGNLLVSDGALDYFVDNVEVLWQVPVAVALLALYYAAVGVAVASLTTRRIAGGAALLAFALVSSAVAAILTEGDTEPSFGALVNLLAVPVYLRDIVFLGQIHQESDLSGLAGGGPAAAAVYTVVLVAALGLLLHRYRWVEA